MRLALSFPNNKKDIFSLLLCLGLACLLVGGCVEGEQVIDKGKVSEKPRSGQQTVPITEILEHKNSYHQKEVTVFGKVTAGLAFEFVSEQPYLLEEKGAALWVVTSGILPADGSWVTVHGTVMVPYQVKGRHYDVVLLEKGRDQ